MERMGRTVWPDPDTRVDGRMTADWPRRRVGSPKLHLAELRQYFQFVQLGMEANSLPVSMLDPPSGHDDFVT
jgi:hypothetical protein